MRTSDTVQDTDKIAEVCVSAGLQIVELLLNIRVCMLLCRKRKKAGKAHSQEEAIVGIDEYLGKVPAKFAKPMPKYCQPESEFWEDYVHFTKTTAVAIKKQRKLIDECECY